MRKKYYNILVSVVDGYFVDINTYFSAYNTKFVKTSKELKSQSYGGYQIKREAKEFEKEINCKCTELMEKIEKLFVDSGRTLSSKQYDDLINRCTNKFSVIIDNYCDVLKKEFEFTETIEISFKLLKENIAFKISNYIKALELINNAKISKDRCWTAWGVIISTILSIIAIIVGHLIE